MMLIAAIAILGCVVLAGMGLGALYIMLDRPPPKLGWVGGLHALGGVAGFELLVLAIRTSPPGAHAVKMGAGGFRMVATILLGAALAIGLLILVRRLTRSGISSALVATHGMLAVTGYLLLVTYLTMLY